MEKWVEGENEKGEGIKDEKKMECVEDIEEEKESDN